MADEILKADQNFRRVVAGISNDSSQDILMLRVDPTTKRLLVDIGSGGTSGTQYTEGDTDSTITGTAIMWEDTGDTLRSVSAAKPLPVNIVSGSSAGTEYTEDAASAADPSGGIVIARRRDSLSSEVSADGDNIALNATAKGELYVKHVDNLTVNSHAVTNAGTFAVQESGAALAALQLIDNIVNTEDNASASGDSGVVTLVQRADTIATTRTSADGDYTVPIANSWGVPYVSISRSAQSNDGPGLLKAEDAAHSSGDAGVMMLAVRESAATDLSAGATNGDYEPLQVDANGRLWGVVNIDQMNGVAVTMGNGASGTGVQRVTIASDSTGQIISNGPQAQDAAITGNPLNVGLRASTAIPTAMSADGDSVYAWGDRNGAVVTKRRPSDTPSQSSVAGSASNVTLLAANTSRLGATIANDSTAALYLKLGAAASTTSYSVKLLQDDYYEVPFGYTGQIDGIWASATGNARITELT